jgi:hypothetical protein
MKEVEFARGMVANNSELGHSQTNQLIASKWLIKRVQYSKFSRSIKSPDAGNYGIPT